MAWVAIVNPASGLPGAAARCAQALLRDGLVERVLTGDRAGASTELARQCAGFEGIAVVGGDGTVAEVIAGLPAGLPLALFPVGHGNCLARDLGAPSVARARQTLREGRPRAIDLMRVSLSTAGGQVRQRLAASTLSVGYITDVVQLGRGRLAGLGRAAYGVASAITLPRRMALQLRIDQVESVHLQRTGVVVNNSSYLGNFRALPQARLDDGHLDLMDMDYAWPRQMAHNAAVLLGSARVGAARVARARLVALALGRSGTVMIDGEIERDIVGVQIACLPRSLHCLSLAAP